MLQSRGSMFERIIHTRSTAPNADKVIKRLRFKEIDKKLHKLKNIFLRFTLSSLFKGFKIRN